MRGCVDRLLLFGIDEDVRDAMIERPECRATDRQLLRLVSLSPDTDLVLVCSCVGTKCNNADMDFVLSQNIGSQITPTNRLFTMFIAAICLSWQRFWTILIFAH
ncbi:hypothetical protein AB6A40_002924 [Gnathostoma spinigerum]|uniref:Uncharacterized protein n=1 Tax=Gnathostoma spinigerum TaxID=75299 RepID=A0ABD6EIU5_9BILA